MSNPLRDLPRTALMRPGNGGHFEIDDGRLKTLYDFAPLAIYVGTASLGAVTSAAEWTIKRITLNGAGNPTDTMWTDIRSAIWDNRVGITYT